MILPKQLTTVTPLSKYLAMVLFITLPFAGFYLGMQFQQRITHGTAEEYISSENGTPTLPTQATNNYASPKTTHASDRNRIIEVNNTNTWKTYTNTTHNYSVQYPPGWTIDTTDASRVEDYQDSICCNTAYLEITDGKSKWEFAINLLITGFDAPSICQPGPDQCSTESKPMEVLGYPLQRIVIRANSTNTLIKGYLGTLGQLPAPAFGQIGIKSAYASPEDPKYMLSYEGESLEKNLNVLDTITKSLQKSK
jgi:hypothetical protein